MFHAGPVAASQQSIELDEQWSTKGPPDVGEFVSITGMIEVTPGIVWVADSRSRRVLAIYDHGQRFSIVAREGEGPGEVVGPGYMALTPNGEIAVHDLNRSSIEIFTATGDFIRRVNLLIPVTNPKGFAVLPSSEFILSGGTYARDHSIHRFSSDGRLLTSWDPVPKTRNPRAGVMIAGGPVHALPDGNILFSRSAPHELVIFGPEGNQLEEVASDPDLLQEIGDDFIVETVERGQLVRSFRWFFPQSQAVFRFENGVILNIVVLHEQGRSLWEVYTPGQPVERTIAPKAYRPWALTRDGGVLVSYLDPETDEAVAALLQIR